MKRIFGICFLATILSCEQDSGKTISGTVENVPDGQRIFISQLNADNNQTTTIDTVQVEDGNFEAELPEQERPVFSFLTLEGVQGNLPFVADNSPVEFTIYKDSLRASEVRGGRDNELLYTYFGEVRDMNTAMASDRSAMMQAFQTQDSATFNRLQQRQQQLVQENLQSKKQMVQENPNSIVSVIILQDIANADLSPASELRELYDNLSPEVKDTHLAQTLDETINRMSLVAVGGKAPDFSAPTPEGEELAMSDALGKLTLIDFWASWCKPCREENPNIVRVYEKYKDQGFNVLGVSLDRPGQKDKWEQAIKEDNLNWDHVSNLMFWQDPIAEQYGIRAIPAAFLLDEKGVIIAKDLRGQALEDKVAEVLGEE